MPVNGSAYYSIPAYDLTSADELYHAHMSPSPFSTTVLCPLYCCFQLTTKLPPMTELIERGVCLSADVNITKPELYE
ncbi:hypothetical protein BaRGS_00009275 [Batillaria attramentaria]|uniref:Uncharacterized protein n=1 Tax=Batillaria attramentaria TaxID=370345 RepID=A0ABD0LKJ3_9CAEN